MMFEYGNNWSLWHVALMWVGMIAFWGLVIWGVYALVRSSKRPRNDQLDGNRDRSGDLRHILDVRLANGEIDADEYHRVRGLITHDNPGPVSTGDQR